MLLCDCLLYSTGKIHQWNQALDQLKANENFQYVFYARFTFTGIVSSKQAQTLAHTHTTVTWQERLGTTVIIKLFRMLHQKKIMLHFGFDYRRAFRVNRLIQCISLVSPDLRYFDVLCVCIFCSYISQPLASLGTKYVREMFAFGFCFHVVFLFWVCCCSFQMCVCVFVCLFISFVRFWFDLNSACYFFALSHCYNDAFARSIDTQMHKEWKTTLSTLKIFTNCTHKKSKKKKICIDFFSHSLFISTVFIPDSFRSIISTQCLTGCNKIKIIRWICAVRFVLILPTISPNDSCEYYCAFSHRNECASWIYSIKLWGTLWSSLESCKYCDLFYSWPHDFISPENGAFFSLYIFIRGMTTVIQ